MDEVVFFGEGSVDDCECCEFLGEHPSTSWQRVQLSKRHIKRNKRIAAEFPG